MATIKGKWKWNDTCTYSKLFSVYGEMNFTSNEEEYTCLGVESDVFWGGEPQGCYRVYYEKHNGESVNAAWFLENGEVVLEYGHSLEIKEQEIDDELYAFILANATEYVPTLAIGEKLTKIAENEQRVYDKGKAKGYQEGLVSSEAYEKGKQAEYDAFWNMIQESGKRTEYSYAFAHWAGEYIRPKYKVVLTVAGSQKNIFYMNKYVKKIESAYFDFSQLPRGSNVNQTFSYCFTSSTALEEIEDIGLPISYSYAYAFAWCSKLRKIAMIRVDETTQGMENAFTSCIALESVAFEGVIGISINLQWSTKLTRESIENIINHLSDNVSGKTLTLSEAAVDKAFETEDLFGSETDEWATLCSSKPNWKITLV